MVFDYDLLVIGAGSGGVRASRMAASLGAKVAVIEQKHLGGTCVNLGCIPKKLFAYAAHYADDLADAAGYGWTLTNTAFDWLTLRDNKEKEIQRLNSLYKTMLETAQVAIIYGNARLIDKNTVQVNGRNYSAERILIATGAKASVPKLPGIEHAVTSDAMFYLPRLPQRAVVVGGGYIAVEFAGILAGLGVATTQLHRGPSLLRGFDQAIQDCIAQEMLKKGIAFLFEKEIIRINKDQQQFIAELNDGSQLTTDLILYATGRSPNTDQLGLEALGVKLDAKGAIIVNENFQSSVASIYALGDVINRMQLTPVALAEAMVFVKNIYAKQTAVMDYEVIPTAVFSQPNIATVGLTETQAREKYAAIQVYTTRFRPLKHTLTGRDEKIFMKLIVDTASDKVLGAHMLGAEAGEIIQGIAVAIKAGATKAIFDSTIGIHPTAAEEFVTLRQPQY